MSDDQKSMTLRFLYDQLAHSESDIREKEVKLDTDDGKVVYEIEWKAGKTEYDYEVDAITGQILKAEKDIDD